MSELEVVPMSIGFGEYLNVGQAVEYLRVGRSTLYELMREGALAFCKVRGRTILRRCDLDEYMEQMLFRGR